MSLTCFQQLHPHTCILYKSPDPGMDAEWPWHAAGTPLYATLRGPDVAKPIVEPNCIPEDCMGGRV